MEVEVESDSNNPDGEVCWEKDNELMISGLGSLGHISLLNKLLTSVLQKEDWNGNFGH